MKKTAISILLALLTFTALAQTSRTDTYWRNDATGDWLIGFAPRHVIYAGKVWEITSLTEKNDAYTLTLDNGTTVKVGRMKNGTRAITFGKTKPLVCSKITGEALPDYPIKDARQGFVDNGYRTTDSVTIVGWLKDMPEELWKEHRRDFTAILWNICTYDQETFSAPMDSLGRFTLRMPLLNLNLARHTSSSPTIKQDRCYGWAMMCVCRTSFWRTLARTLIVCPTGVSAARLMPRCTDTELTAHILPVWLILRKLQRCIPTSHSVTVTM